MAELTRSLLSGLNSIFRFIENDPEGHSGSVDEESGITFKTDYLDNDGSLISTPSRKSIEPSDEDILKFLDTVKPHPLWWNHYLLMQEVVIPDGEWLRFDIEFKLSKGETEIIASPHTYEMFKLIENEKTNDLSQVESISLPQTTATDRRVGWITRAQLKYVECDTVDNCASSIWISLHIPGYGKGAVGRHRKDVDNVDEYWTPLPDLLEAQDLWDVNRHHLTPYFAGNRKKDYFMKLIIATDDVTKMYKVSRELPLVYTLMLWADTENEWARDAVRRPEDDWIAIPVDWYNEFAERMESWLKLWKSNELPFRLRINNPAACDCIYQAEVFAKCVFVKDMTSEIKVEIE